ncbi:50S ribosomal protein L15 [Candidatus Woesearchaeota archaeon]|jgi:large subunit ribosomal protein L15|nr:50S ribosomal protein L15 [Candidatus Woesearchaeota archaeon]|tara:strand:- start:1542 stop:1958 length:417 start_codon:yes stop_codon:yes gene_type:complete
MKKRKKNVRQRGNNSHGWGSKKKHRGAGNRGGRGRAGSGKRGDAKKPSFWKEKEKKGFVSLKKKLTTINISNLEKFNDIKLDLKKQGFDKLLGKGEPKKKYEIKVSYASQKAIKKIQSIGGKVSLLVKNKQLTKEPEE